MLKGNLKITFEAIAEDPNILGTLKEKAYLELAQQLSDKIINEASRIGALEIRQIEDPVSRMFHLEIHLDEVKTLSSILELPRAVESPWTSKLGDLPKMPKEGGSGLSSTTVTSGTSPKLKLLDDDF